MYIYIYICQNLLVGARLPETSMFAPENGCLEYKCFKFSFWDQRPISRGELLVSGSVNQLDGIYK